MRSLDEVLDQYAYHPATPDTAPRFGTLREEISGLAKRVWDLVPDGPEKTLAFRKLQEAQMYFNLAIALSAPADLTHHKVARVMPEDVEVKEDAFNLTAAAQRDAHGASAERTQAFLDAEAERNAAGQPVLHPSQAPTPPEDLVAATIERKNSAEREKAKATNIIKGQCYGPVAMSDPEHGFQSARCYYDLCTWQRERIVEGSMTLTELQQAHNDAGMPLTEA